MVELKDKYAALLADARARVEYLRSEIALHEDVIVALEKLVKTEKPTFVECATLNKTHAEDRESQDSVPSRLNDESKKLLLAMWEGPRSLDDMEHFCEERGIDITRPTLGARLNYYKRAFAFIETPRAGMYGLTEKARKYFKDHHLVELSQNNDGGGVQKAVIPAEEHSDEGDHK